MGCLFACFTAPKQQKRSHFVDATPSKHLSDGERESLQLDDGQPTKQVVTEEPIKATEELKEEKVKEQLSCNEKKEVNFDFDFNVKTNEDNISDVEESKEDGESENKEETELIPLNVASASTNHRYQNCEDEEYENIDLEGGDDNIMVEEESSDLFSLSIDSRKHVGGSELASEREVTSPMPNCDSLSDEVKPAVTTKSARDRSHYVEPVLNPVENLTQWKSEKAKTTMPLRDEEKENINVEQDFNIPVSAEPSFKFFTKNSKANADNKKQEDREVGVDTSLSSWLVEPETTPASNNSGNSVWNSPSGKAGSPISHEDRPVLGVLTMEELKKLCVSNSHRSPTKTTVLGTVGSYWRHTGQSIDSDSGSSGKGKPKIGSNKGEGESVKWICAPFEAKLESCGDR